MVAGTSVPVGTQMKYLGLHLDGSWSFCGHFERLAPRALRVANNLGRLLPNLGGLDAHVRRLYAGVVHSVLLYGAPIVGTPVHGQPPNSKDVAQSAKAAGGKSGALVLHCLACGCHGLGRLPTGGVPRSDVRGGL